MNVLRITTATRCAAHAAPNPAVAATLAIGRAGILDRQRQFTQADEQRDEQTAKEDFFHSGLKSAALLPSSMRSLGAELSARETSAIVAPLVGVRRPPDT